MTLRLLQKRILPAVLDFMWQVTTVCDRLERIMLPIRKLILNVCVCPHHPCSLLTTVIYDVMRCLDAAAADTQPAAAVGVGRGKGWPCVKPNVFALVLLVHWSTLLET